MAKQWTVMVWMAGDNDLEDYALGDVRELKKVGSSDAIDVVVQVDRLKDSHTRRYHLKRGTSLAQDQVASLGETNTGDPAVAADFFTWGITTYPAKRYLAVLWNHGSGIDETDVYARARSIGLAVERRGKPSKTTVPRRRARAIASKRYRRALFAPTIDKALHSRAIAYDDTSRDFLDNLELKKVLATVRTRTKRVLDVVGFDACLMNMLEIGYELRTLAGMIVGSQEVEPGDGWPYDKVLAALAAKPQTTPEQLGRTIVDAYVRSYGGDDVTLSLLASSRAVDAAAAVDALAGALLGAMKKPAEYAAVNKALRASQHYEMADFVDLCDFCDQTRKRSATKRVKDACADAIAAICDGQQGFVRAEGHKGATVARSHGISIYFPRGDVTVAYDRLAFAKQTRWNEFLATL